MTNNNDNTNKNKNKTIGLLRQMKSSPTRKEGTPVQAGRQRRFSSRRSPTIISVEEKPKKHRSLSPRKVLKALLLGGSPTEVEENNDKDNLVPQKQPSSPSSPSSVIFHYPKPIDFRKGEEPTTPPMKKQSQVVVSTGPERRKSAPTRFVSSPIKGVDDTSSTSSSSRQVQQDGSQQMTSRKKKSPRQSPRTPPTTTSPPFGTPPITKKHPILNVLNTVDELPLVKPTVGRSKYRASLDASSPRNEQDNSVKKKEGKQRRPSKPKQQVSSPPNEHDSGKKKEGKQRRPSKPKQNQLSAYLSSSSSFQYPKPFSFRDLEDNSNGNDGDLESLVTTTTIDQLPIPMKPLSCDASTASDPTGHTTPSKTTTKRNSHNRKKRSVKTTKTSGGRQM